MEDTPSYLTPYTRICANRILLNTSRDNFSTINVFNETETEMVYPVQIFQQFFGLPQIIANENEVPLINCLFSKLTYLPLLNEV